MSRISIVALCLTLCCVLSSLSRSLSAEDAANYRTDGSDNDKLPWFQLVDGEFPPEGSAHYFSGELISVDHLERGLMLRVDRTDKQNRSHFDLPVAANMLPYGAVHYHGALASLRDIPIGTHLHGWFYKKAVDDKTKPLEVFHGRRSYDVDFTRCFRLEDDFSFYQRQGHTWRIENVDLNEMKLTATLQKEGKPHGDAQTFELQTSTRVYQGRAIATLEELAKDQTVQFNITWATLYGPGRIVEIWLDEESRNLATEHQRDRHNIHIRQRGLPGWVTTVNDEKRIVTITFFGNVDSSLFDDVKKGQHASVCVAEQNLLTFDPVNDRKSGPILEVREIPPQPGSSGVQIEVQPSLMLEGYRPKRIVRVYPSGWPIVALPKEEQLFGR